MSLASPRSILIAGLLLLSRCQTLVKPVFSGDHPTGQIRYMWSICYAVQQRSQPFIHPQLHVQICDCMIDSSRRRYKSAEYKDKDEQELIAFFTELNTKCTKSFNDGFLDPKT